MDLYTIIRNFLLTLFPETPTDQCLAWVDLASIVSITLIFIFMILFVIWCFKLVSRAFRL